MRELNRFLARRWILMAQGQCRVVVPACCARLFYVDSYKSIWVACLQRRMFATGINTLQITAQAT